MEKTDKFEVKNKKTNHYSLNKNPNPILFNIFFSKVQKNLCCPKRNPIKTKRIWYKGKIKSSRTGVNQKSKSSFTIPNQKQKGFDSHAEAEPVRAKTINIMVS